ncbi:MAG: DNA-processing protein DprA [Puniceicoccales bacterium]|jgi:DNA processing protein|nr:DNA-processing protein DprA [Puniceicoccales bacterium]
MKWDREVVAQVCNALPYLGPHAFHRLVERLGSDVGRIFSSSEAELVEEFSLSHRAAASVLSWETHIDLEREYLAMERCGGRFISCLAPDYPQQLRAVDNAPIGLYVAGRDIANVRSVAIVGSRICTFYGEMLAQNLAKQLVEAGYAVASGLAKGIDLAAHGGALAANGHTIAVLAGALDSIYPPENAETYHRIRRDGTLASEFSFGQRVQRQNFAIRNRIITGLSAATVVVESPCNGGSMLSARFARDQKRPLFAVPGRLSDPRSAGCLKLIREGAHLFTGVEDLFQILDHSPRPAQLQLDLSQKLQPCPTLEGIELRIWKALARQGRATAEELAAELDMAVLECAQLLQTMRIGGAVTREPSGEFVPC